MPKSWHKFLVRNGAKPDVSIKEFVNNVENYEEYERKFPSIKGRSNANNFRGKGSQYKKNMCRILGCKYE